MTEASGLASVLASRLQALWGIAVEVTGLRQLSGGASRESWDIGVRAGGDTERRLILLRDAGGRAQVPEKDIAVEAGAMIAARQVGVPAPHLHDYGDGALGRAYLLMDRLDGETIPRRLLRDDAYAAARPGLARRLGEVLARIHQVDPGKVPGLPEVDALGQLTGLYRTFAEPRPALEIGLRWLGVHQPAPVRDTLRFHARVAANALRIAEREALLGTVHVHNHRARLAALGCADDAELCAAIRDGSLDHRFDDVTAAIRAVTVDKLTVANPAHLALPG